MPTRKLAAAALAALSALLLTASTALAVPKVDGIYKTPTFDGSNAKIAAGPDGNMWLVSNDGTTDVIRIGPDGTVTPFKLGAEIEDPVGIAAGPDGRMWVTSINKIGSFLPADPEGSIDVDGVASITSNSPLVAGPDGQMWAAASNNIVHWKTSDPAKAEAISVPGLDPKDIDVAGQVLAVASNSPRIVTMTTAGVEQDFTIGYFDEVLKVQEGNSQGVAGGPNGQIAYSQPGTAPEQIGLINPPTPTPLAIERDGDPFGVALGSDQAYWFTLAVGEGLQRLTTDGQTSFLGGLPPKFFARQIAAGPNNTLWVTLEKPGEEYAVARITGLEPPVKQNPETKPPVGKAPETKLDKAPKGKVTTKKKKAPVTFKFSSTTAGAGFECALVKKPAKKGKKAPIPAFKACKSPHKLKLKPGKYTFHVRAVLAGVPDGTPATSSFRVVKAKPIKAQQ